MARQLATTILAEDTAGSNCPCLFLRKAGLRQGVLPCAQRSRSSLCQLMQLELRRVRWAGGLFQGHASVQGQLFIRKQPHGMPLL